MMASKKRKSPLIKEGQPKDPGDVIYNVKD